MSERPLPKFARPYSTPLRVARSDFENNTLTFTGHYYKSGEYAYEYTPRSVDARAFLDYRRQLTLSQKLQESSSRALSKEQRQKEGGLLSLNIPLKSKAIESLFGEGGAGLKVSGYHLISFSGRSTWDDRASSGGFRQNKFPSLNMEQISRFDINGTIGTKISVSVSQDSKTDIPLANRIILRYKGDEDDVIKSIEAGNTTLSLPNTQFVGYSSRIQGLFGIKTAAQLGNLTLTAIASQEKGTTERNSLTAGASAKKEYIRDYQYANGKIYDLGLAQDFRTGDSILKLDIYAAVNNPYSEPDGTSARMYGNIKDTLDDSLENCIALVKRVDPETYEAFMLKVPPLLEGGKVPYVIFDVPNAGTNYEIGVWMIIRHSDNTVDTIGDISSTTYRLKLLRSRKFDSSLRTWEYLWRNVYYLGMVNIPLEGLEIKIFKGPANTEGSDANLEHQEGPLYVRIFGLDKSTRAGDTLADGLVDVYNNELINQKHGLLIFPDRRPFAPETAYSPPLAVTVPDIYNYASATEKPVTASTYYIEVSSRSRATQINLGKPNIIEGSERITVDGQQLIRDQDYEIQYDFGVVTFKKPEQIDPNANVNIDYEYSPFISAEKKTLFGIRGEYEVSDDLRIGSTFLYKSDKATDRKPKIGQETARMMVWDADASFRLKPNFLTKAANLLPLYYSEAGSSMAISGEVAQSYPNPNVDGVAYLDDFEGSRDSYSLGLMRQIWTLASKPIGLGTYNVRAKLIWYNPYKEIATTDIWKRDRDPNQQGTQTLWLVFEPHTYDRRAGGDFSDSVSHDPNAAWGGVMRYMPSGSANQERAQLLELRVFGQRGVLHIDLGEISEDVNGNGVLDTEDSTRSGQRNNILDDGEDIGLDGQPDRSEDGYRPDNLDPNGDNWYYNSTDAPDDYRFINGTEGNGSLEQTDNGKPDAEDLNLNQTADRYNRYFSYRINLADTAFLVDSTEHNGWRTFRIPIKDTASIDDLVGNPSWTSITYARLWVESLTGDSVKIGLAAADLIQSNWDDTLLRADKTSPTSSRFNVAVINTENDNYFPPSGVSGNYNKSTGYQEPEQSLLLHYDSLKVNDTGLVHRLLYDTPSLVGYRTLEMYVHGASDVRNLFFFFRVGQDSANFYEYRTMLEPGWSPLNAVKIDFNEITGLKEYYNQNHPGTNPRVDTVAGKYRIYGLPRLTQVKYVAMGVINLDSMAAPTGDVWVDELRLTGVRRDVGFAGRISVSGNVADLFTYSAGYTYKNSFFRGLSTSTRGGSSDNLGSGRTNTGYNFSINFGLDKFLPRSLGASLPVSLRYSKNVDVPLLRFGTDIILPKELRDAESSISVSKGFTLSESFNKKTWNPLFTLILNKVKANFSYNRTESTSPSTPVSLMENYHIGGRADYSIAKVPYIKPFFWTKPVPLLSKLRDNRFYFFPNSYNFSADLDRTFRLSENSSGSRTDNLTRDFRGTFRGSYKIADNLSANYGMDTRRDMSDPETVAFSFNPMKLKLGRETSFNESFGSSYTPNIVPFFTHKFNYSAAYREDIGANDSTRNVAASKSYGVSGDLNLQKLFGQSSRKKSSPIGSQGTKGKVIKVEKKNPLGGIINPFTRIMGFLTGWINPISYEFNERYNYSFIGLRQRAQLKFRFGLTDQVGVPINSGAAGTGQSAFSNKSTGYSFGSGTELFGGLKADVSFNRKIDQDLVKAMNPQKSVSTTFPDIRFNIRTMTTFRLFNPIISRFSPRTGYSRSRSENINLQTGFKSMDRTSTAYRPLISFTFDIMRGMQVNVNTDKQITDEKVINSQTGTLTTRRRNTSTSLSASTKYSFTSPSGIRFPLLGRLKFNSTMTISVSVSLRKDRDQSASGDNPLVSSGERSEFQVTPDIQYTFSSQIKGGLSARWQDSKDAANRRNSHLRELRIWVEIRF
ncbi:MAG: cell surface protein SprA [candidate division Zixibacteria bacterium]|nr:cell surface protein SprA [candidate division Zixibacteria bacterium]